MVQMNLLTLLFGAEYQPKPAPAPRVLPGRNDPCWCGSGKKYKACHAQLDLQVLQAEREKQRSCTTFT
jgi:hypothetical protein